MTDEDIALVEDIIRRLEELLADGIISRHEPTVSRIRLLLLHTREELPPDHPLHPNQDHDDVPEFGDPRT